MQNLPRYENGGTIIWFYYTEKGNKVYHINTTYRQLRFEDNKYIVKLELIQLMKSGRQEIARLIIGEQEIAGDHKTIKHNIARVIGEAMDSGYFEPFLADLEGVA